MNKYFFNRDKMSFDKVKSSGKSIFYTILRYCLFGLLAAVVMYVMFAVFINTNIQKQLSLENEYLEEEFEKMASQANLLDDVITNLEYRDKAIYNDIFSTDPPSFDAFMGVDTTNQEIITSLSDAQLADYSKEQLDLTQENVSNVNRQLKAIFQTLDNNDFDSVSLPSILPVDNFKLAQTGASKGMKINPFYKTLRQHTGLDIISAVGTEVFSTADGVVSKVEKTAKGLGNNIVINHANGIQTRYAHLSEIYVHKGQNVNQRDVIARVGMSGKTFAAGLHYEVLRQGRNVDPVYFLFADLSPSLYRDMILLSSYTGQSID
ncbi:MAG: M23 family metallopeptidase [Bacteroidales bacterium]|nr:M23 family metallopeptidase [Bacteroidales bacterium]